MSIHVTLIDNAGGIYNLTTNLINFATLQWGETKKIRVILKNTNRITTGIEIKFVAHPTAQVGSAEDTYESALLSDNELGPFVPVFNVASMSPNEEKHLWLQWSIPPEALPGWGQYAIQITGVVDL